MGEEVASLPNSPLTGGRGARLDNALSRLVAHSHPNCLTLLQSLQTVTQEGRREVTKLEARLENILERTRRYGTGRVSEGSVVARDLGGNLSNDWIEWENYDGES